MAKKAEVNVAALKTTNLEKAKAILATKGLTFVNVGISKTHITIGGLSIDYTDGLKASVKETIDTIGISERAAIALFLEKEIAKIPHANLVSAATEATKAKAEQTAYTAKLIAEAKAAKKVETAVPTTQKDIVKEVVKAAKEKPVELDLKLKEEITETAKDVMNLKSLIYPQIVISDTSIKFAEYHEITGILAVAEAKKKAENLMAKTGITSERMTLVYLYADILTFVPKIKATEKTFSIKFDENQMVLVVEDNGKFSFHNKFERTSFKKTFLELQAVLGKIAKLPNPIQKLQDLAEYLVDTKVNTFSSCIPHVENFLGN